MLQYSKCLTKIQGLANGQEGRRKSEKARGKREGLSLPAATFPSPRASCILMNPEPGEYELALRARQGDPDALAELVARTRLRLLALAYAELRHYDDAPDAVASALLQICRHVRELREPERVREW